MLSTQTLMIIMGIAIAMFVAIIIAYFVLNKKMKSSEYAQMKK